MMLAAIPQNILETIAAHVFEEFESQELYHGSLVQQPLRRQERHITRPTMGFIPKQFAPEHILLYLDGCPVWKSNMKEEVVGGRWFDMRSSSLYPVSFP
jgi:hypothetical protein